MAGAPVKEPGPRSVVAVLIFELAALAFLAWLAMGLASCCTAPRVEADYLDRGVVACNVIPSDGVRPCVLELETSDERIVATLRGLTGCVVRTRQIERQPDFRGVF